MKTKILCILLFMFLFAYMALAQNCSTYDCHTPDNNNRTGAHNFQRSDGTDKSPCAPCHKPHNAGDKIPLWNTVNKFDDGVAYSAYTSPTNTLDNIPSSNVYAGTEACMSCHDGMSESTGYSYPYFENSGPMGVFYVNYSNAQHPIGMNYDSKADAGLNGNVVSGEVVGNIGKYKLVGGKVECITCHDPHKKGPPGVDILMTGYYTMPEDQAVAYQKLLRSSSIQGFCNDCHQDK